MSAYLDNPSGTAARVDLGSTLTVGANVGDYIEFSGRAYSGNSAGNYRFIGYDAPSGSYSALVQLGGSSVLFRPANGVSVTFNTGYTQPAVGADFTIRVERSATNTWRCLIDGVSVGTATQSLNFTLDRFFAFDPVNGEAFKGRCYYVEASTNGGASVTNYWDPSVSSGSTFEDTTGANDGTLTDFATDGSQWVAPSDTTAPTLTSPTASSTGETTASGSVSTDEANGTLYWVVTTSGTAPSAAQVQAGQDNTGTAAAASGSQSVSATGSQAISPTGLTADTTYTIHYQHEDAAGNDSTVVSSSSFTTDASATFSIALSIKVNTLL